MSEALQIFLRNEQDRKMLIDEEILPHYLPQEQKQQLKATPHQLWWVFDPKGTQFIVRAVPKQA